MKLTAFKAFSKVSVILLVVATFSLQRPVHESGDIGALEPGSLTLAFAGQVQAYSYGFDTCDAPSNSTMSTWWNSSPAWWWGVYLGGVNMSCANNNVTQTWINNQLALTGNGWRMLFIWVGPQPPCSSVGSTFSSDPSTAAYQGHVQADNAISRADALGINLADLPIVYDMEAFPTSCVGAAQSFMNGWTKELHAGSPSQISGLYGSGCGSSLDDFYGLSYHPNFIWGANTTGNISHADTIACVASNHWVGKRHKQYEGGVSKTYGGVNLTVDMSCSNGAQLYGNYDTDTTPACS